MLGTKGRLMLKSQVMVLGPKSVKHSKTMYIACNNATEQGYSLGDMIVMVKVAWLFVKNEPHDKYILSLYPTDRHNCLWDKFIKENNVQVVYDNWPKRDLTYKYKQFNNRISSGIVTKMRFDTYKELYSRMSAGERQAFIRGRELEHYNSITEYYYYGQSSCNTSATNINVCGDDIISYNKTKRDNSVFLAIHEKCQGNRTFTLEFWEQVILKLLKYNIKVEVNDNTKFMNNVKSPNLTKSFDNIEKLISNIASKGLVVCGNTGIGWVAVATATPLIAMERDMSFSEYGYARCGCKSLIGIINKPDVNILTSRICDFLKRSAASNI